MTLTPRQIRNNRTNMKSCAHHVVLYSRDDVGYPSGWVENWICLACDLEGNHSTGGDGHCLGQFGYNAFSKTLVVIDNEVLCSSYGKFEDLFKKLREVPQKEWMGNVDVTFRKRNKIERFSIDQDTTPQEVETIISRIEKILG